MEIARINKVAVFRGTPKLAHDAEMVRMFGGEHRLRPEQKIERRIVYALCLHMIANGFKPYAVYDGEELVRVNYGQPDDYIRAAMELIFNLDESSLRFMKEGFGQHGVLLVTGNGCDIICDWNYYEDDRDGFDAVMQAFDPYEYV